MIIDTDNIIEAYRDNEFIGRVDIINLKEKKVVISDKEYDFKGLTICNCIGG